MKTRSLIRTVRKKQTEPRSKTTTCIQSPSSTTRNLAAVTLLLRTLLLSKPKPPKQKGYMINMPSYPFLSDPFPRPSSSSNPSWTDLDCKSERKVGPFLVKTLCKDHPPTSVRRYTCFVKLRRGGKTLELRDMSDYASLIQSGTISHTNHYALFHFLDTTWKKRVEKEVGHKVSLFNHNLEVGSILHFKYK